MGCDIHTHAEVRRGGKWEKSTKAVFRNVWYDPKSDYFSKVAQYIDAPFDWRSYRMYGFLANVRNSSHSPVIAEPRGLPHDVSSEVNEDYELWGLDAHSSSWLTLRELDDYEYALLFEDHGKQENLRDFLGDAYFEQLEDLKKLGEPDDVRVVFWFDN